MVIAKRILDFRFNNFINLVATDSRAALFYFSQNLTVNFLKIIKSVKLTVAVSLRECG